MKNRYFYTIVTAVTVLLCLPGCNKTNNVDNAATKVTESSDINLDNNNDIENSYYYNGQLTSETEVSTLTPLQTLESITGLEKNAKENDETDKTKKITDREKISKKNAVTSDEWFSAHTLFEINTIEEDSKTEETWFRFSFEENDDTISSSVVKPDKFNISISRNENSD